MKTKIMKTNVSWTQPILRATPICAAVMQSMRTVITRTHATFLSMSAAVAKAAKNRAATVVWAGGTRKLKMVRSFKKPTIPSFHYSMTEAKTQASKIPYIFIKL